MEQEKIKHLEFIQTIITRMNTNSFQIKGWMITLVSALLALYANNNNITYIYVAMIPIITFWFLDSFYLQKERKFIGIYNDLAKSYQNNKSNIELFNMPVNNYKNKEYSYWRSFRSKTIAPLYGIILLLLIIAITIISTNDNSINIQTQQNNFYILK